VGVNRESHAGIDGGRIAAARWDSATVLDDLADAISYWTSAALSAGTQLRGACPVAAVDW